MPTPDGKTTKWAHYKKLKKQGVPEGWDKLQAEMDEALRPIPIPGMLTPSVDVFYKLRALKGSTDPITLGEIDVYMRLYKHELEAWEIESILQYDKEFRSVLA